MSLPFVPPHESYSDRKTPASSQPPSSAGVSGWEDAPPPEPKAAALLALKEALATVPHDEKSSLVHAQRIKPDLVDDDHLMGFLEVEGLNVNVSFESCS